LVLVLH